MTHSDPFSRHEHTQAALSEGICPECGRPVTPVTAQVTASSDPDRTEITRLECVACDTEWSPMGHLAGDPEPRWVRFQPRTATIYRRNHGRPSNS